MENQNQYLIYGLTRNSQNPLDSRFTINNLININTELPLIYRYSGLIFFVISENKHYLFLNNLNTPIALQTLLSNGQTNGLILSNYTTLVADLNNTNPNLGALVTIFPLGVTFVYIGNNNWNYHSGEYHFEDNVLADTLPNILRKTGIYVYIDTIKCIYDSNLEISDEIIQIPNYDLPLTLEDKRYYLMNNILHFCIGNKLYKLSEQWLYLNNYELLKNDDNIINHNFNSFYISGIIWINSQDNLQTINEIIPLTLNNIDNNNCNIKVDMDIIGNILLTSKF